MKADTNRRTAPPGTKKQPTTTTTINKNKENFQTKTPSNLNDKEKSIKSEIQLNIRDTEKESNNNEEELTKLINNISLKDSKVEKSSVQEDALEKALGNLNISSEKCVDANKKESKVGELCSRGPERNNYCYYNGSHPYQVSDTRSKTIVTHLSGGEVFENPSYFHPTITNHETSPPIQFSNIPCSGSNETALQELATDPNLLMYLENILTEDTQEVHESNCSSSSSITSSSQSPHGSPPNNTVCNFPSSCQVNGNSVSPELKQTHPAFDSVYFTGYHPSPLSDLGYCSDTASPKSTTLQNDIDSLHTEYMPNSLASKHLISTPPNSPATSLTNSPGISVPPSSNNVMFTNPQIIPSPPYMPNSLPSKHLISTPPNSPATSMTNSPGISVPPASNNVMFTNPQIIPSSPSPFNTCIIIPSQSPQPLKRHLRPYPALPQLNSLPAKERLCAKLSPNVRKSAWARINSKSEKELSEPDLDGDTQLMVLLTKGHDYFLEVVYAMVERLKRIPNALTIQSAQKYDALYLACCFAYKEPLVARYVAETIIQTNGNVANGRYEEGNTLIHMICKLGDKCNEVLAELLSIRDVNGKPAFDVNCTNDRGETPLHVAVLSHNCGNVECFCLVRLLLSVGADVRIKEGTNGDTCLHYAASHGCYPKLIEILLSECQLGTAIHIENNTGNTALHLVAANHNVNICRQKEACQVLLEYGAQKNVRNRSGKVPLMLISHERKKEITAVFNKK